MFEKLESVVEKYEELTKKVADKLTHLIDAGMIPTS